MKIKEIVQTTPNFQVLSEDEIERIYFDALGIIESDGARVENETALERFKKSEAVVTDTNLVRIPTVLGFPRFWWNRRCAAIPEKSSLPAETGSGRFDCRKMSWPLAPAPCIPLFRSLIRQKAVKPTISQRMTPPALRTICPMLIL